MIAYAYREVALAKAKAPTLVATIAHRVQIEGTEFVAVCGERWSRLEDTAVYPDYYSGPICAACGVGVGAG